MDKFEKWRGFVPDDELATYQKATFGNSLGFGQRAALINIDTTRMFVDPEFPQCGEAQPELIKAITRITDTFRRLDLPIYYCRRDSRNHPTRRGMWNLKIRNGDSRIYAEDPRGDEWPAEYAPRASDMIVYKNKPSGFFGTMLESWLRYERVDTVVVIGLSTSGCIRATVDDAFARNFHVIVVDEACGDRCRSAHRANLFDIDMKFGDVENIDDVTKELDQRFGT